jgi:plasmid segregation protein ParM
LDYHLRIVGAKIYPQGYAAVAPDVAKMDGVNLICDIGNGTMNLLYIVDGMPETSRMFTEKYGTYQCTLMVRERFLQKTQREIPDAIIEKVLRTSTADIPKADLQLITEIAETYAEGILRRLREHGYDGNTMKLIVTGGGGCLLSNFGKAQASVVKAKRIIRQHDICAAAKGYEYLAELQLRAGK